MSSYKEYRIDIFDDKSINYINNLVRQGIPVRIVLNNTKGIQSEHLNKLMNSDLVQFRIIGGLDKKKYDTPKYKERTTYKVSDLKYIIKQYELIEKTINPKWTQKEKALHIYKKLASYMSFDQEYERHDANISQSLRSIINKKGICAGFSLTFKELMNRQGIECDYVRGKTNSKRDVLHAWNVLHIDGEIIPVDVTWDSGAIHRGASNLLYFGNSKSFISSHKPESDERITDYERIREIRKVEERKEFKPTTNNIIEISQQRQEVKTDNNVIKENTDYFIRTCQRDDGSIFILTDITTGNSNLHEYLQCELNPDGSLGKSNIISSEQDISELKGNQFKTFVNDLLAKSRIEKYTSNGRNGYLGFVDENLQKRIDTNLMQIPNQSKRYGRNDGTSIILERDSKQPFVNSGVNSYRSFEFVSKLPKGIDVKVDRIYSEVDITKPTDLTFDSFFATHSLERKRIDDKVSQSAGYVGSIKEQDSRLRKIYSPQILSYITGTRINQNQYVTTSMLENTRFAQVNTIDYGMLRNAFKANEDETYKYARGFTNYKYIIYSVIISVIIFIIYILLKYLIK